MSSTDSPPAGSDQERRRRPRVDDTSASFPKSVAWRLLDQLDARRGKIIPPRRLRRFVGAGDYEAVGQEFLGHCVQLGSLRPQDQVLDIGSGIGRLALPLSEFLKDSSTYLGVDTWPTGIEWCERHIGAVHPNFKFDFLDVFDEKYNPRAPRGTDAISIDAASESFDFATLISILHLEPYRIGRYLAEIGRLLRPGGRYLGTWYLVGPEDDPSSDQLARAAVPEESARSMLDEAGIDLIALYRGRWNGRRDGLSYQDIIVGQRRTVPIGATDRLEI